MSIHRDLDERHRSFLPTYGADSRRPLLEVLGIYIRDGFFLLPYLAGYLCYWCLRLDVSSLEGIFQTLHVINVLIWVSCIVERLLYGQVRTTLKWVIVCAVFVFPGLYLEYPSDAWEHFRRIFRWQEGGLISSYQPDIKGKFIYFWLWTLVEHVPLMERRLALGICAAFSQLFLAVQVYRLSTRFGLAKAWAWVSVLAFFSLFGMSVFSFRYYAISSTIWSYALYLGALSSLLDFKRRKRWPTLIPIPVCLSLIYFLHKQELIFFAFSAGIIVGFEVWLALAPKMRRIAAAGVALTVLAGVIAGPFVLAAHPGIAAQMFPGQLNSWGFFRVWNREYWFYQDAVGVYGVLAYFGALIFFRIEPRLAALSIAPILTLVFPPTAMLMAKTLSTGYLTFRVLYIMPLTFALVRWLELAASRLLPARYSARGGIFVSICVIIMLGTPMEFPWRGKIYFQLHHPSIERSLSAIDETAEWFKENRDLAKLRRCWLTTDDATRTVVYGHIGASEEYFGGESSRRAQMLDARLFTSTGSLANMVNMDKEFCGILVAQRSKLPAEVGSHVASIGRHWPSVAGDLRWLVSDEFESAAAGLVERGWKRTFVPPFYYLYEP